VTLCLCERKKTISHKGTKTTKKTQRPEPIEALNSNQVTTHRTARIVPVIAHAITVFGDEHKASHWLSTPLPLFDNQAPSELLETEGGVKLVERTLTRIEHNIFS
jgi:putative toxin-antitoxin system antitoxin component (TIGR02293 family)